MATWTAGNRLRLSVAFTDLTGAAVDPGTVSVKYALPGQVATVQTYNPGNVIRDGVGLYHYDYDSAGVIAAGGASLPLSGEWISTGAGEATSEPFIELIKAPAV